MFRILLIVRYGFYLEFRKRGGKKGVEKVNKGKSRI